MLLSPRLQTADFFVAVIFLFVLLTTDVYSQPDAPENQTPVTVSDTTDTLYSSVWPSLIRSALVPGLGQIHLEKPGRAVIFYGASLALLYNALSNYRDYKNNGDQDARYAAYTSLALLSQVYLINLLDVIDTQARKNYRRWPQDLYSDVPVKSPWGAAARTAMLPGWGQVYNEQYLKSVIAFGSFAFFASQIYLYNQEYQKTGDKYYWDKRVVNSWYLGLTYVVILLDAYVDAYLFGFDEAMGLSLQVIPERQNFSLQMGVRLAF